MNRILTLSILPLLPAIRVPVGDTGRDACTVLDREVDAMRTAIRDLLG